MNQVGGPQTREKLQECPSLILFLVCNVVQFARDSVENCLTAESISAVVFSF